LDFIIVTIIDKELLDSFLLTSNRDAKIPFRLVVQDLGERGLDLSPIPAFDREAFDRLVHFDDILVLWLRGYEFYRQYHESARVPTCRFGIGDDGSPIVIREAIGLVKSVAIHASADALCVQIGLILLEIRDHYLPP
jgi:voltage-gated potassium channel Kch